MSTNIGLLDLKQGGYVVELREVMESERVNENF